MSSPIRKRIIKVCLVIGILIALPMAANWFMTYRLEDSLRKRLRQEVISATDGFYDFSFEKLDVGLFSGELMIKGLSFFPDSTALKLYKDSSALPKLYFDVYIDTIRFKGVNLTWRFSYRKLSFDEFVLKQPSIKIISGKKDRETTSLPNAGEKKSVYQSISPYFDIIQAKYINFQNANVEYIVEDSTLAHYKLEDFSFTAHKFIIDEQSEKKEHLLFSDNFEFKTTEPQVIYDSDHFLLNINQIRLSTMDSIIHIRGFHLEPKTKYWDNRFAVAGSCVDTKVEDVVLDGIAFSRKGDYNFLDVRHLAIKQPNIEYFHVAGDSQKKDAVSELVAEKTSTWSLYSMVSPLFERLSIKEINLGDAKFQYSDTRKLQTDVYTLNNLNFSAYFFQVDSMSHKYNFFLYAQDYSIDADSIASHLPSKNSTVNVDHFYLSTAEKVLRISEARIAPIKTSEKDSYTKGSVKEIEITGLNYKDGLDADKINIVAPQVNIILGKKTKKVETENANKTGGTNFLDVVAPFVSYVSVKDINIKDGRVSLVDKKDNNSYKLDNLDFYAHNFYMDKETRRLQDYFFRWDEYSFKFRDFDNLTPDRKYRIQIKQADFNSVSGNMLLKNLEVAPQKGITGSYVSISTPYASLLGLNEKAMRDKKILFKTFILDSPVIKVVKGLDDAAPKATPKADKEITSAVLQLVSFDLLTIPSPSFYFYDVAKESSVQVQSGKIHIDSLRWELNKHLKIHNLGIESPYISLVEEKEIVQKPKEKKSINLATFGDIDIGRVNVKNPVLKVKKASSYLDFSADNYLLRNLYWSQQATSILQVGELDLSNPTVFYQKEEDEKEGEKEPKKKRTKEDLLKAIPNYVNETALGRINISNLNLRYSKTRKDGSKTENALKNTYFLVENVNANLEQSKFEVGELAFKTSDINYPIMDSFYTLRIGDIDFSKKRGKLNINRIQLDPNYPKFDFAYMHPKGKDWFKMRIDSLELSGIDGSKLITDTILLVKKMRVNHVLLENLKNQKIVIEHNKMPLLYQQFQRLPLKYWIGDVNVNDFTVIYEELAKNGYEPARIPFGKMNGQIENFTNIQKGDNSFYTLNVNGLAMGTAPFVGEWKIPVDSTNDKFYLKAEIKDMDMRDFNQLVRPMAPVYVERGRIHKLSFETEASSLGATVDMEFVYDSLYVVLLRKMDGDQQNSTLTHLINRWAIKSNNQGKDIRLPHDTIVRDPYHSNFNYFWQIIKPPLITSVGISEKKQSIASDLLAIINRVKRFFKGEEKKEKKQ